MTRDSTDSTEPGQGRDAALVDLACDNIGGAVLAVNDEFFAPKENLIAAAAPVWKEGVYTDRGKWMDGWETRRRREPGYDWAIVRLGMPGRIRELVVDTAFFRGNYPEHCSVDACAIDDVVDADTLAAATSEWFPLLSRTPLTGDTRNRFPVDCDERVTHVRLNIFPDGGVARLRVLGVVVPDFTRLARIGGNADLAALHNGGRVVGCSDEFFGVPSNLLRRGRSTGMHDGWETRRRRGPGHDWVIVELGSPGTIYAAEVDTSHFKGNAPGSCSLEVCDSRVADPVELRGDDVVWRPLVARTPLTPHTMHTFEEDRIVPQHAHYVRLNIFPDGGVARLRLVGEPDELGELRHGMVQLNSLSEDDASEALRACCGSTAWVLAMVRARPFPDLSRLFHLADTTWLALPEPDWLEAFAAHPKIGEHKSGAEQSARWSEQEQTTAQVASRDTLDELAALNHAYHDKFGYIFIVCASGLRADQILDRLRRRIGNDKASELRTAAHEQRKITRLRLEKWLRAQ